MTRHLMQKLELLNLNLNPIDEMFRTRILEISKELESHTECKSKKVYFKELKKTLNVDV